RVSSFKRHPRSSMSAPVPGKTFMQTCLMGKSFLLKMSLLRRNCAKLIQTTLIFCDQFTLDHEVISLYYNIPVGKGSEIGAAASCAGCRVMPPILLETMDRKMDQEAEIGRRIKSFRKSLELTLRDLAEKTGFSQGYLSKVENSPKAPPVSTLIRLSKALSVSMNAILGETEHINTITLVRKGERSQMARDGTQFGYWFETLAPAFVDKRMTPYLLTMPPNVLQTPYVQHEGQEVFFILEGTLRFIHGQSEFTVRQGDCLYFDSSVPHTAIVLGDKEARILAVIWSP
ncbi:MAG: cupin domain-containing protein, partial [Deltaproteobacteria bacterium]|nr:cupin domain-containing protein [Deltaproteobacteria bacterium]